MPKTRHLHRVSRSTQQTDTIYVTPTEGAFVTPDGEGRYWYYRSFPEEYGWPADVRPPANLTDAEAAIWVAQQNHGDDLDIVYLEEDVDD